MFADVQCTLIELGCPLALKQGYLSLNGLTLTAPKIRSARSIPTRDRSKTTDSYADWSWGTPYCLSRCWLHFICYTHCSDWVMFDDLCLNDHIVIELYQFNMVVLQSLMCGHKGWMTLLYVLGLSEIWARNFSHTVEGSPFAQTWE